MSDVVLLKETDLVSSTFLSPDTVRAMWSKTYNADGLPDWTHIFPYYDERVVFQDCIQRIEGFENFQALCNRLTNRCTSLRMDLNDIIQKDNVIAFDWKMTMSFRKSPDTPIFGFTKLTIGPNGKIISQRDYYDLWGDIFNGIPGFNKMYRKFMSRFFG